MISNENGMAAEVSIIIVNYNTGVLLYNCLKSIREHVGLDYEVIVADNNSGDDSVTRCAQFWSDDRFRLISIGENLGFSRANNIAASGATGKIFHFLNPDTELAAGMTRDYITALRNPENVYVNPLMNSDGSLENDRMPVPVLKNIILWNKDRGKARYWYKGASVIISGYNFRKIGGWCEDYFLFSEDLDLFYEIWEHGIPIKELPAVIYHLGGGSTRAVSSVDREIMVQKSLRLFFRKHYSTLQYVLCKLYYLLHNLVRHPSAVPLYLKAWLGSLR